MRGLKRQDQMEEEYVTEKTWSPKQGFKEETKRLKGRGGRIVVNLSICVAILSKITDVGESGVWI